MSSKKHSARRTTKARAAAVLAAAAACLPITAIAGLGATPAQAATDKPAVTVEEQVHAYVAPSIVYVDTQWAGLVWDTPNHQYLNHGHPLTVEFTCTGFVVNPNGYVGTAGHCVNYDQEVAVALKEKAAEWARTHNYYEDNNWAISDAVANYDAVGLEGSGTPQREVRLAWSSDVSGTEVATLKVARVISAQPFDQGDAALLKVEATGMNALPVAATTDAQVGQQVVTIGYPASVDDVTDENLQAPTFTPGSITAVRTIGGGIVSVYETSAALSPGMSGGPMVDAHGQVIGINSFKPSSETQAFNFGNPSQRLTELMRAAGVPSQLSADTITYRKGLDAFFAGNKKDAVAALTTVTKNQPSNGLAQSYLRKAEALPNPPSGPSPLLLAGAAVGLVVVGAGVFVVVRRRRGAPTTGEPITVPAQENATIVLDTPAPAMAMAGAAMNGASTHGVATVTAVLAESGSHCRSCSAAMVAEQRFCGHCGTMR